MEPAVSAGSIFVAGHRGLVGSALVMRLQAAGLGDRLLLRDRSQLDLTDAAAVRRCFAEQRPSQVYLAAAKVGGILANDSRPVDFLRDNLLIQLAVIEAAVEYGVDKLLFLGSSCIYPKHAAQPMSEDELLAGPLEPTNEWYAIAKIAGIKLVQAHRRQDGLRGISLMPTNLYGPGDNFDLQTSHVLPALIRKFHQAVVDGTDSVEVWGSGRPRREFLHVDDLADACVFCMEHYEDEQILNVGVGEDVSIAELATLVAATVGFTGEIRYDASKPDGTPRKLLDVSRLHALGWQAKTPLRQGIAETYAWYRQQLDAGTVRL
jgi:GDP-L-fucose synthase